MENETSRIKTLIAVAHNIGWMGIIGDMIESDDELVDSIISIYDEWYKGDKSQSFEVFVCKTLKSITRE